MAKIERKLAFLRVTIITVVTLVIITPMWFWVSPDSFQYISAGDHIVEKFGGIERLNQAQRIGGYLATMIPISLLIWTLVLLYRLTIYLAAGQWFDQPCERIFNKIGTLLLLQAATSILSRTLLVLILTITNPPGERALYIGIESSDITTLVPALLSLVIAHMMQMARAQRDELNQII
jgi:hypothetical protein